MFHDLGTGILHFNSTLETDLVHFLISYPVVLLFEETAIEKNYLSLIILI